MKRTGQLGLHFQSIPLTQLQALEGDEWSLNAVCIIRVFDSVVKYTNRLLTDKMSCHLVVASKEIGLEVNTEKTWLCL